jgi:hypothetical protein
MTPAEIARVAEYARQQVERDAAAGYCTRYVEDIGVLTRVAIIMTEHEAQDGGGGYARPA